MATTLSIHPMLCNAQSVALAEKELNEELKAAATISGLLVVGAVRVSEGIADAVSISAAIPAAVAGKEICLSLVSADGLYEAENTFRIEEDWQGGSVEIPYPTKHSDRLLSLRKDELAALARVGNCNSAKKEELIPIAWRSLRASDLHQVAIFVNSFGADEVIMYPGTDPFAEAVECRRIETNVRTAYDTSCDIDTRNLNGNETLELELIRISEGHMTPSEFIEVELGAAH